MTFYRPVKSLFALIARDAKPVENNLIYGELSV